METSQGVEFDALTTSGEAEAQITDDVGDGRELGAEGALVLHEDQVAARRDVRARRPEAGRALVEALSGELRARVVFAESVAEAVRDAAVICTATSAREPILLGETLEPGVHVNAVGSFRPEMQEFDAGLISRAHVFIDSVEACLEEAGELIAALAGGVTNRDSWTELGAVLEGAASGRSSPEEITLFKSVGLAAQDACAAGAALEAAVATGLGQVVDFS